MGGRAGGKKPAAERDTAAGAEGGIRSIGQNSSRSEWRGRVGTSSGYVEWLRGVPEARVFTPGVGPDTGASGGAALHLHPHQTEQFPQSFAAALQFREQQFADIVAFHATGVGVLRLAQRFSRRLVRS